MAECEYCLEEVIDTEGTCFNGLYCLKCLRLVRAVSLDAIHTLQRRAHERRLQRRNRLPKDVREAMK